MEINIKKVMSLDLYRILDIDEDATDSDVSNIVLSSSTQLNAKNGRRRNAPVYPYLKSKLYATLTYSNVSRIWVKCGLHRQWEYKLAVPTRRERDVHFVSTS